MYRDHLHGVAVFFQSTQAFVRRAAIGHPLAFEPLEQFFGGALALGFLRLQQLREMSQIGQVPLARRCSGQSQGGPGMGLQAGHQCGNAPATPQLAPL